MAERETSRAPLELPGGAAEADAEAAGAVTFIGTATMLIRTGPFTILTDPNFLHRGERAYIGMGLHTRRRTDPALEIGELPPLDFVVLSHHHGDHFDQIAARQLPKDLPIITEPHSARKLRNEGFHCGRAPEHLGQAERLEGRPIDSSHILAREAFARSAESGGATGHGDNAGGRTGVCAA